MGQRWNKRNWIFYDVLKVLFNNVSTFKQWDNEETESGYRRENIHNLIDQCNDDCNVSLEFRMRILERRNEFVYKHKCAQTQRSRKLRLPKDVFAYTREIRTVI